MVTCSETFFDQRDERVSPSLLSLPFLSPDVIITEPLCIYKCEPLGVALLCCSSLHNHTVDNRVRSNKCVLMEGGKSNHGDEDIILQPITTNIQAESKESKCEHTLDCSRLLQLPKQERRRSSVSFSLEVMREEIQEPMGRRPSMMILMDTMTIQMRSFSEISEELDQSVKGLAVVLTLAIIFVIFIYCINWFELYLYIFDAHKNM